MKNSRYLPLAAMALILIPTAVLAANLTGTSKGPMKSGGESVFQLKADRGSITGNMLGRDGKPYPVTGKLDGDAISMTVAFEWQSQPVKLLVTGKRTGDDMQVHIAADNGYWSTDAALKRQPK
ncbi:MAG TPA: hypothetical protein VGL74_10785 [Terriglobales bacterium]